MSNNDKFFNAINDLIEDSGSSLWNKLKTENGRNEVANELRKMFVKIYGTTEIDRNNINLLEDLSVPTIVYDIDTDIKDMEYDTYVGIADISLDGELKQNKIWILHPNYGFISEDTIVFKKLNITNYKCKMLIDIDNR